MPFGEKAKFHCAGNDTVTDYGFVFELLCQPNGKYQQKKWGICRERGQCYKTPPRPPIQYGLARNYSRTVKEFAFATYQCIDPNQVR